MTLPNILLVDDDPGALHLMGRLLEGVGQFRVATNGVDALRLARELPPDLVLLDAEMPGMNGFRVCEEMKADRRLSEVPVIFVTSHDHPDVELTTFALGAVDFITKPVLPSVALARIAAHLQHHRQADGLRRAMRIDPLTHTLNPSGFDEALQREWQRAQRSGEAIALLSVDLDHYALLMESLGQPEAERALQAVARVLAGLLQRPADLVARLGEGSFAALLPLTPRDGALHVAQAVLDVVESLRLPAPASPVAGHVTVSIGIGCHDSESLDWVDPSMDTRFADTLRGRSRAADLLNAAEIALRAAKSAGCARVWQLDTGDADTPRLAREVSPGARDTRRRDG